MERRVREVSSLRTNSLKSRRYWAAADALATAIIVQGITFILRRGDTLRRIISARDMSARERIVDARGS
jgi:uncharacterized DUF497 family protein